MSRRGRGGTFGVLGGVIAVAIASVLLASSASADQPIYEPNDIPSQATGPLQVNGTYEATLETNNDVDYFYFYVTAPTTAQVTIKLENFGGGADNAILGILADSHNSRISGMEVEVNDYGSEAITLKPGKYYFLVDDGTPGDRYKFTTTGTDGAFGAYATIAANCAAATGVVNAAQATVAADQANQAAANTGLKNALSKLKKAQRHGNHRAIAKARHKVGKANAAWKEATAQTAEAEKGYKGAVSLESPWCFIPQ